MKYIIMYTLLILGTGATAQAQTTFETLLVNQQKLKAVYMEAPNRLARRRLYKAEDQLMAHIKEQGYSLRATLKTTNKLPVYEAIYPTPGTVVDSIEGGQTIQIFGKDEYGHGYYKVQANGKTGYVYRLDKFLADAERYPLALVNKYGEIDARVHAILSKRINNGRVVSSSPCSALINGQHCGKGTSNGSGRCDLHQ